MLRFITVTFRGRRKGSVARIKPQNDRIEVSRWFNRKEILDVLEAAGWVDVEPESVVVKAKKLSVVARERREPELPEHVKLLKKVQSLKK